MANTRSEPRRPTAAVIVAHPDDEALWCGGYMLQRPDWDWFVLTLCRGSDADRSFRFARALRSFQARGAMADLDDSGEQQPLAQQLMSATIARCLPSRNYDLVLTHGPRGEYTRHRRHEECCLAVAALWTSGQLRTEQVLLFAYSDDDGHDWPRAQPDADEEYTLEAEIFQRKYELITQVYGFGADTWEARTTPATEGFYRADTPSRMNALILANTSWEGSGQRQLDPVDIGNPSQ